MDSNIMERKSRLTSMKICRFCLNEDDNLLRSLYDKAKPPKRPAQNNLPMKIQTCISVEVFPSDKQPGYICENCRVFMELFYKFKLICRQADEAILHFVQHGTELVPIPWPAKLSKLVNHPPQSPKKTEKTPSTLDFDEDTAGGNVYNIKIGDGVDDDSKEETCIKVVKSGDKISISKENDSPKAKGSPQAARPFTCKACDKSFVKHYHYTRHVRVKHPDADTAVKFRRDSSAFHCDLCPAEFRSQDELIYHSAQHATQNLTCPLCHEKFLRVEEVSQHIKSHVDGEEFLCDMCELVFTHKEKLDRHVLASHGDDDASPSRTPDHADEEESMEHEEDDEDLYVKEVDGQMVVEVKKPGNFIKEGSFGANETNDYEGSDEESRPPARASITKVAKTDPKPEPKTKPAPAAAKPAVQTPAKKQEAAKPKEVPAAPAAVAKEPPKTEKTTPVGGASDKSLRLLEKELQELQRTNNNTEASKPPVKIPDMFRGRKSAPATPRPRPAEERKSVSKATAAAAERKTPARAAPAKETPEPRDDDDTPKEEPKNGASERPGADSVRRSHRTSKVNNYATVKRIGYSSTDDKNDDDENEEQEEEESKRKPVVKQKRKIGRPRKPVPVVPEKKKKPDEKETNEDSDAADKTLNESTTDNGTPTKAAVIEDVIRSPSGQTLKKVPVKALPPGVKPMPLPASRPGASGEVCKMQIGQKMVKVQKIVMTKAEVEAMKKKGLLEVKDGTMVLKQGIKLPTSDSAALKSTLVGETAALKESPAKKEKATPTRCDVDE